MMDPQIFQSLQQKIDEDVAIREVSKFTVVSLIRNAIDQEFRLYEILSRL